MADRPFGFGMPDKPEDRGGGSGGPGGGGSGDPGGGVPGGGAMGPFGAMGDPQQFADALRQFADMLSYRGGPVNWDLAKNVARHAIVAAGDPSVLEAQRREITEAVRLADLWLDEATEFPSGIRKIEAWSRSEWLEATFPVWAKLCDPIAAKGVEAMSGMFTPQSWVSAHPAANPPTVTNEACANETMPPMPVTTTNDRKMIPRTGT